MTVCEVGGACLLPFSPGGCRVQEMLPHPQLVVCLTLETLPVGYTATHENCGGVLTPCDRIVLEADEEGGVTIALEGNGNSEEAAEERRGKSSGGGYLGFATRQAAPPVEKMRVLQNGDGSITITPSGEDNVLQVTDDPHAGQVVVTENQPLPNVPAVAD